MVLVGAAAFRGLTAASRSEAGAAASVTSRPSARFAGAKFAVRTATVPTATATIASPPNNIIRVLAIAPSPVREEPMDQLTCMLAREMVGPAPNLGSGTIAPSQKMTVAARAMAEKKDTGTIASARRTGHIERATPLLSGHPPHPRTHTPHD